MFYHLFYQVSLCSSVFQWKSLKFKVKKGEFELDIRVTPALKHWISFWAIIHVAEEVGFIMSVYSIVVGVFE